LSSGRRLGPRWLHVARAWLGLPSRRRLARAILRIDSIRRHETAAGRLSDAALHEAAVLLRGRARGGEPLDQILPEAFGLVCVAAARTLGLRPFDVQLAAGVILHEGAVAELATGEGKTLVATLPAFLNALTGKGVHIMTVNDYLARRDAEWFGPVHQALGLSVGALQGGMEDRERAAVYRCDITYGAASDFGFDFLRDRLKLKSLRSGETGFLDHWAMIGKPETLPDPRVQRDHHYALVDEADSIFIDEARTPLIIGGSSQPAAAEVQAVYLWADRVARRLEPGRDFRFDAQRRALVLAEAGVHRVRWSSPPCGEGAHALDKLLEHVERAVQAHHRFRCDQHYLIEEGKIVIIDEYSGRKQPSRHWQDGLHQAVEAKEGVTITAGSKPAAQVTYQNYFKIYRKLAGMSGTAAPNWSELWRVYTLRVVCVPTNRPVRREQWPDWVFPNEAAKLDAVVEEVRALRGEGRPVLIGTRSVEKSEELSRRLRAAGLDHQVLNAKEHEREVAIVARAGQSGQITIATNMAGRGTDIQLGPGVAEAGGLHVLGTERHEARRIDCQLAGRAGRQGDPGSCQFLLSLEDDLLEGLGPARQAYYRDKGRRSDYTDYQRYRRLFVRAQRLLERRHRRQRIDLLFYHKHRHETLKDIGADPFVD
jgi:preprotein translocase subunit SecA